MGFVTNLFKWFIQGFSSTPSDKQDWKDSKSGDKSDQSNYNQIKPKYEQLGSCRECLNAFDNTSWVSCNKCTRYTCYDYGKNNQGCVPIGSLWCKSFNKIVFDEFLDVRGCSSAYSRNK